MYVQNTICIHLKNRNWHIIHLYKTLKPHIFHSQAHVHAHTLIYSYSLFVSLSNVSSIETISNLKYSAVGKFLDVLSQLPRDSQVFVVILEWPSKFHRS